MKMRTLVILAIVLLATTASRLLPHPANFAPLSAIALFGAMMLRDRWLALLTPLLARFVSDYFVGFYESMWAEYLALAVIVLVGFQLRDRRSVPWIAGATVAGSVIFFLISNFGFWLTGYYGLTFAGLMEAYVAGIPFFRGTLVGDLVYSAALFGGFALAARWLPALRLTPATVAQP